MRVGFTGELPENAETSLFNEQKRLISALVDGIRVINVYVPNGSNLSSEKYKYKIQWLHFLKKYLQEQSKRGEPTCLLGDFNIAPEDRDLHNPKKSSGGIMASKKERENLKDLLDDKLEDVFRVFEPGEGHWSWWDYRTASWERDQGWRIDQIYLSDQLIRNAKSCKIHKKLRGNIQPSDHVPVVVEIKWPIDDFDEDFLSF